MLTEYTRLFYTILPVFESLKLHENKDILKYSYLFIINLAWRFCLISSTLFIASTTKKFINVNKFMYIQAGWL